MNFCMTVFVQPLRNMPLMGPDGGDGGDGGHVYLQCATWGDAFEAYIGITSALQDGFGCVDGRWL